MKNYKFASRYLPKDELKTECEKLGERFLSEQEKCSSVLPIRRFIKLLERFYLGIKKRYLQKEKLQQFEREFLQNYRVYAEAMDYLSREKQLDDGFNTVKGIPSIYLLMAFTAENSRGRLDADTIKTALEGYQKYSPYGINELCGLKNACRYALIKYLVNLIEVAQDIVFYDKKAAYDAENERFSLSDIKNNSYVGAILNYAGDEFKVQIRSMLLDNGLDHESISNMLSYKKGDLVSAFSTVSQSLNMLNDCISDEFLLSQSVTNAYLAEINEERYLASDNATKMFLLGLVANGSKKGNERAFLSEIIAKYGDKAFDFLMKTANFRTRKLYLASLFVLMAVQSIVFAFIEPLCFILLLPLFFVQRDLFRAIFSRFAVRIKTPTAIIEKADREKTLIVMCGLVSSKREAKRIIENLLTVKSANRGFDCCFLCDFMPSNNGYFSLDEKATADYMQCEAEKNGFGIVIRKRSRNADSGMYEGYEKKRGALEELNEYLLGEDKDFFKVVNVERKYLNIITLDEDGFICCADDLCAAIKHPLNQDKCAVSLCGKPKLSSTVRNSYTRIFYSDGGFDKYSEFSINFERDVLNCNNYTGKGIYHIREFTERTVGVFPDNAILSHDFIEGCFCGTVSSACEVLEDCPDTFAKDEARRLRWLRGDAQLLPYLFARIRLKTGKKQRNPLTFSQKAHILSNILKGLSAAFILAGELVLVVKWNFVLFSIIFACIATPITTENFDLPPKPYNIVKSTLRAIFYQITLPYRAVADVYALIITAYRLIRRKNLLKWQTFAHAKGKSTYIAVNLIFSAACLIYGIIFLSIVAMVLSVFFLSVFLVLGMSFTQSAKKNSSGDELLKNVLRDTWRYFDVQFTKGEYLIADNCRIKKEECIFARRTSPTNIGFSLVAVMCAYLNGLICKCTFDDYIGGILKKVMQLKKWHGHLYNWYDTCTCEPMYPHYVSSVDSGNFFVCLRFIYKYVDKENRNLIDKMTYDADFSVFYDEKKGLLRVGYNQHNNTLDAACYDLMASEALLTYVFCIGYGKIPNSSIKRLGMRFSRQYKCLYSWTGGMFEYLMPWLFLSFSENSALGITAKNVVKMQIRSSYDKIWGISESQYLAIDDSGNYKYRAFGLPDISLSEESRGGVFAPYASVLALESNKKAVLVNLARLCKRNMYGKFGFYEALDLMPVKTYMAHHQGMIMLAISNYFIEMPKNVFCRDPKIRGALMQCEFAPSVEKFALRKGEIKIKPSERAYRRYNVAPSVPSLNFISDGRYYMINNSSGGGKAVWESNLVYNETGAGGGFGVRFIINGEKIDCSNIEYQDGKSVYFGGSKDVDVIIERLVMPGFDGEMMYVSLRNKSNAIVLVSAQVCGELILAKENDYLSHPEFYKLFIESESQCTEIICVNRKSGVACAIGAVGSDMHWRAEKAFVFGECVVSVLPKESIECAVVLICGYNKENVAKKCSAVCDGEHYRLIHDDGDKWNAISLPYREIQLAERIAYKSFGCNVQLNKIGIKKKYPLVVISVKSSGDLYALREKIKAYVLMYKYGIRFDISLSVSEEYGYYNVLKDKVNAIICTEELARVKGDCAIEIVPESQGKELIKAVALSSLDCYGDENARLFYGKRAPYAARALKYPKADIESGVGYFTDDKAFVIKNESGFPLSNIMACEQGGFVITQNGGGFCFAKNARENKLTAFDGESRVDAPSECIWVEENGNIWPIIGMSGGGERYCVHETGQTSFIVGYNGIESKVKVGLSPSGGKSYVIELRNLVSHNRKLRICYAVFPALGNFTFNTSANVEIKQVDDNMFTAKNLLNERAMFIKFDGLNFEKRKCQYDKVAKMLQKTINLPIFSTMSDIAHDDKLNFSIQIGENICTDADVDINWSKRHFSNLSMFKFEVEKTMDIILHYLPYQTYCSRFYGRTGYYQVGGAYGYRDQLQDCLTMLYINPRAVKEHIILCCGRQFEDGDVMHWWHAPFFGVRTRIMDDRLFLPYVVAEYIAYTGECELLAERVAFLKNIPLSKADESVCDNMTPKAKSESVLEHCKRAIFSVCSEIDDDGIVFMRGGDWNDGMNLVGNGGGKSVWLSMFLYEVIAKFLRYFTLHDDKKHMFEVMSKLKIGVNAQFNGRYFSRAILSNGAIIGSPDSSECKIDLLTQAYAVISGITSHAKGKSALLAAEELLIDRNIEIIKLLDPPFLQPNDVGYIGEYPRGVRENGGQYTHAAVWFVIALYKLGEKEKAYEYLQMLNPVKRCTDEKKASVYKGEPYVLCADIYAGENAGKAGWTWYTGAASWYYVAVVRYMFGITIKNRVITFSPQLPNKIKRAEVTIKNGDNSLKVEIDNSIAVGQWHIVFGGVEYNTDTLDLKELKSTKTITLKRCSNA